MANRESLGTDEVRICVAGCGEILCTGDTFRPMRSLAGCGYVQDSEAMISLAHFFVSLFDLRPSQRMFTYYITIPQKNDGISM